MALRPELKGYRKQVQLLDGRHVVIRPISPEDQSALIAFHSRLSDESRFHRYHYSKGELTQEDLTNFCDVDFKDSLALVADQGKRGKKEIIGVGRFYRLPSNTHTAEVAFVVQDSEQRKGICTHLLKQLAALAWERDIYFFLGVVMRDNSKMLSILRKSDPEMHQVVDDYSTTIITFSVEETMFRTP